MNNLQSDKYINISPKDGGQVEKVFVATKRVLEVMEDSKHRVSSLQKILNQNEQVLDQLSNHVKALKNSNNQNTAHLKCNYAMKNTVQEHTDKFLNFAQMIYLSGQELYTVMNSVGNDYEKFDEQLATNGAKYELRIKHYENVEKKLSISLELLEKQNLDNVLRQKAEECENNELKEELNEINKKISLHNEKNSNTSEQVIYEENTSCEKNIELLGNDIALLENKLRELSQSIEEKKKEKLSAEEDLNKNITDLNHMCEKLEEQLSSENSRIVEMKDKNEELCFKISNLESIIASKSEKCTECSTNIMKLETQLSDMKKDHEEKISSCEKIILDKENLLNDEKSLNKELSYEMDCLRNKIEEIENELIDLKIHLEKLENIPEDHLNEQLEKKQIELMQIKSSKRVLKERLRNLENEQAIKIKLEQKEIEELEKDNEQLLNDYKTSEVETEHMKSEIESIEKENLEYEKDIAKLAEEIKILEVKVKSDKLDFVKPVKRPRSVTNYTPKKPVKAQRKWDDSSSEDEKGILYPKRGKTEG